MTIYPNLIIEALKNVRYPGTGCLLYTSDAADD